MKRFLEFLSVQQAFCAKHKSLSALILALWVLSAVMSIYVSELPFVLIASALALFMGTLLMRYEKNLEKRIAASDGGPLWQVVINGVVVGEMPDSDYAEIRRSVFFDVRSYVLQLMNMGSVVTRMIDYLFLAIPITVFWLCIGSYFFAPEYFTETMISIQSVTPDQAFAALPMLSRLLALLAVLCFGAHLALGRPLGFVNRFTKICDSRVCRAVRCVAEGKVELYRAASGGHVFSDEMESFLADRFRQNCEARK